MLEGKRTYIVAIGAVVAALVAVAPTVGNLIIGAVVTAIAAKALAFLSRL
jgi:hypothetical protein